MLESIIVLLDLRGGLRIEERVLKELEFPSPPAAATHLSSMAKRRVPAAAVWGRSSSCYGDKLWRPPPLHTAPWPRAKPPKLLPLLECVFVILAINICNY